MNIFGWILIFAAPFFQLGGFFAANITGRESIFKRYVIAMPLLVLFIGIMIIYGTAP